MTNSTLGGLTLAATILLTVQTVGYAQQKGSDSGQAANERRPKKAMKGSYAEVNGLKMYYEIQGSGQPLVLLHGSFGLAEAWATVLPTLTKSPQVLGIEQ